LTGTRQSWVIFPEVVLSCVIGGLPALAVPTTASAMPREIMNAVTNFTIRMTVPPDYLMDKTRCR
jgi:hypothetical protein